MVNNIVTTKQADDIIDAVMERIYIEGPHSDDAYPQLDSNERKELISLIKNIIGE